ncbi:hypothetical protein F4808DRAFT_465320 [Astrocystis sublimbata]|nr:hypothetical protein F4808DRAFT_465320 [Astrocystis sublimbata]
MSEHEQEQVEQQHPSYDTLRLAHKPPMQTPEADRIFWTLNGPLHSSIFIVSRGSLKPYALGPPDDASDPTPTTTWHPISQHPLTDPKVSSITVKVSALDDWEDDWCSEHYSHLFDPPEPEDPLVSDGLCFADLPGYDPAHDEEPVCERDGKPFWLMECCWQPRPRNKNIQVIVRPLEGSGRDFVTIHDWISTLHPRLMEVRDDIIAAMCLTNLRFALDYEAESAYWLRESRKRPCPLVDEED